MRFQGTEFSQGLRVVEICTSWQKRQRCDERLAHPQASECEAAGVGTLSKEFKAPEGRHLAFVS